MAAQSPKWVREAFESYTTFKNHQVLPVDGGILDQSAYFVNVLHFCGSVAAALDRRRDEKNELVKSMGAKKPKTGGR